MSKKPRKSVTETNNAEGAVIPVNPATDLFSALFVPDNFQMPEGTVVASMSPMIKPGDFPAGRRLLGKFSKLFKTKPADDKDGAGIEITPDGAPVGIAIAAVTTIARALKIEQKNGEEPTSVYLGRYIVIERMEKKIPSKRGQDAWNFLVAILPEGFTMQTLPASEETAALGNG